MSATEITVLAECLVFLPLRVWKLVPVSDWFFRNLWSLQCSALQDEMCLNNKLLIVTDGSVASSLLKACFSCGEDPSQVPKGISIIPFAFDLSC